MQINMKQDVSFVLAEFKSLWEKKNLKYLMFILAIYLFGYLTLFRANVYYLDDLRRTLQINQTWTNFSRYMSDFVAKWVNMTGFSELVTLDISPLSQILAIFFLAIASLVLIRIFKVSSIYSGLIATAAIGLSPFYLENMSYKMDSPYMALAVLGAIFPFLFARNVKAFFIVGALSLLLMYTTYQPANAAFILVTIFLAFDHYLETSSFKKSLLFIGQCLITFVVAIAIYKFLILNEVKTYVSSEIIPANYLMWGITKNLIKYYYIIYDNFVNTFLGKIAVFVVISLPVIIAVKTKSIISTLLSIVVIVVALCTSFGLYTLLSNPLFAARALNGIGVFFALVLLLIVKYSAGNWQKFYQCINVVFAYNLMVIAFTYGNALATQQAYNEFRSNALIYDLNANYQDLRTYKFYITGEKIIAPRNQIAFRSFPVLNMLVQEGNQGGWVWTAIWNYWGQVNYDFTIWPCYDENTKIVSQRKTDMYTAIVYENRCLTVNYHKLDTRYKLEGGFQ